MSVFCACSLVKILFVKTGRLGTKDDSGDKKDQRDHKHKEICASGYVVKRIHIPLTEKSQQVVKHMSDHSSEQRAGGVHGQRENSSGEEIYGKILQIEVKKRKERGAEHDSAHNSALFVFVAKYSAINEFFTDSWEDGVCDNKIYLCGYCSVVS